MLKRFSNYIYIHRRAVFVTEAVLLLLAIVLCYFSPHILSTRLRSVCMVEGKAVYVLTFKDGKSLELSVGEHRFTNAEGEKAAPEKFDCSGFFISSEGHVVTTTNAVGKAPMALSADSLAAILSREKTRLAKQAKEIGQDVRELDYYSQTHSVIDDGYNEIMEYREKVIARKRYVDSVEAIVASASAQDVKNCHLRTDFSLLYANPPENKGDSVSLYSMKATLVGQDGRLLLLHAEQGAMPASATTICPYAIPMSAKAEAVAGLWAGSPLPDAIQLKSMPKGVSPYVNGALCSNSLGQACGVYADGEIIGMNKVCAMVNRHKSLPLWIISDAYRRVVRAFENENLPIVDKIPDAKGEYGANVRGWFSFSGIYGSKNLDAGTYAGRIIDGKPDGFGRMEYKEGELRFTGHWTQGKRTGVGLLADTAGRTVKGTWKADTISSGIIATPEGIYSGGISATMVPEGQGSYSSLEKHLYYWGNWHNGKRHGYGYEIGGAKIVRSGVWRKGRFRGEQMVYTKDRVYGIDISRYQHEIGRRKHPISWPYLRISSLGTSSKKRILGRVDYPVSFVYIKASQGTRVWNRYYASDIRSARRCGYRVGAYHFLSTRKSGRAQAAYFLKVANPRPGDMPPMLDVEPTNRQIAEMGGRAVLFRQILAWMHVVENATGTKPVLYVGQEFVNRHLPHAPAELSRYQVWIARYGQFKPYVHLLYWQLSADGRIRGIKGHVDVNVYNGTKESFQEYIKQNCVKH